MLRHVVVLGASGSGKTVACKVLVEEAVRTGIPVIAVDPQGDLASLSQIGSPDVAMAKGVPVEVSKGWYDRADVKIWTPGSTYGIPLSISTRVDVDQGARSEDKIRAYGAAALNLAAIAGLGKAEEAAAAFSIALEYADEVGILIENLGDFAALLRDPPRELRERVDPIMEDRGRKAAAKRFMVKMHGASRLLFTLGRPINVDALLGVGRYAVPGKTRVSVVYLNTLATQEEKEMFVAALCNAVYQWMLDHPSSTPQAMFYLDEAAPYLPPVRVPASKAALMLLLRQARKYGMCCLVATQSPGDLDYKALGQIGTWIMGRMRTHQEAGKVYPALAAEPGVDADAIVDALPAMEVGQFILSSPDNYSGAREIRVRWLVSAHRTLTEQDVEDEVNPQDRVRFKG